MAAEIDMAQRGVFPPGINNLEEFQVYARKFVFGNMARVDDTDGSVTGGFGTGSVTSLLDRIEKLPEISYEQPGYDRLITELKRRILNADEGAPSWQKDPDTSQIMANAVDDLHAYMEREIDNGEVPDLKKWEDENMSGYLLKGARIALFKLPESVTDFVKFETKGGAVDVEETYNNMADQLKKTRDANGDTTFMNDSIREFGEYLKIYGNATEAEK